MMPATLPFYTRRISFTRPAAQSKARVLLRFAASFFFAICAAVCQFQQSAMAAPAANKSINNSAGQKSDKGEDRSLSSDERIDVGGVLLSPTSYRVAVRPGQRGELTFSLANPTRVRTQAHLELLSFVPEPGRYEAQWISSGEHDASSWFAQPDTTIQFQPGEHKEWKFKYAVPSRSQGCYWTMLRFTPRPVDSTSSTSVIYNAPVIFVVGSRARPVVKVSSPLLIPASANQPKAPLVATCPLENSGEGFGAVGATGELKNLSNNRVLANFSQADQYLLPGTKRELRFSLPTVPDGQYRLSVRAEVGARRLPAVYSDYVVVDGEAKISSEASLLELPPISLEPASFDLTAPRGSTRSQVVKISNIAARDMIFDLSAHPLEQAQTGSIGISDAPLPPGLLVTISPASVSVRARTTVNVRVTMHATPEASGNLWFGIAIRERDNPSAIPETLNACLTVDGTLAPQLSIEDEQIEWVREHPATISFTLKNTGNMALQLAPTAVVLEDGVRLVSRLEVPVQSSGGILPGASLPNMVMLPPDLKPGEYIVEISYKYGEGDDAVARLRVPVNVAEPRQKPEAAAETTKGKTGSTIPGTTPGKAPGKSTGSSLSKRTKADAKASPIIR
jgi:hypothetical protein